MKKREGKEKGDQGNRTGCRRRKHKAVQEIKPPSGDTAGVGQGKESVSLTLIPQTVADAMQKVSESDTSKEEWTDVEWAAFLARAIMNRADCVSEEDLYLLHGIMIRCKGGE